jgi:FkbM family methyltransferase
MTNFVTTRSIYGDFILNRHDRYQFIPLKNKQIPHINEEIEKIVEVINDLGKDTVVIDGGANIGLITIAIRKKTNSKIYSFEPQRQIFYCLCGNVVINNLENIYTFNQGLGDINKKMFVPYIDYTKGRDFGDVELTNDGVDEISVITIDSLKLNKLDFLKLDVESMEINALNGGKETIKKFRPWCWIEYIKSDINDFIDFFNNLDYNLYIVDEANLIAVPNNKVYPWMKKKL